MVLSFYSLKKNLHYVALLVILVIFLTVVFTKEGFSGMDKYYVTYPDMFMDKISKVFSKEISTTDMYKSTFGAKPFSPELHQLNIESRIVTSMIDIGNGMSIKAPVHIPSQVANTQKPQVILTYIEPQETDVLFSAQVIQLPEQEGVIQEKVNENNDYVELKVKIPPQIVVVPEQNTVMSTSENFHL